MNRKEMISAVAEQIISDSLRKNERIEVESLVKPISKLMLWAYNKGIEDGISMSETELKNAV